MKRFSFQIVAGGGSHFIGEKEYVAGQTIETTENLQERFPGKFLLVNAETVNPTTPAVDLAPDGAAVGTPAGGATKVNTKKTTTVITPPEGVGLSAKSQGFGKYMVTRDDNGEVVAKGITKRDAKDLCAGTPIEIGA